MHHLLSAPRKPYIHIDKYGNHQDGEQCRPLQYDAQHNEHERDILGTASRYPGPNSDVAFGGAGAEMQRPVVYIDVGNLLTMLKVCVNATSYYAGQIGLPHNPWKAHFASTFTEVAW
jgi:hypothetical protein